MTDYDHAAIDELLHSRVRLAIVAFLAGAKTADFSAVRTAIKTTDGNASIHLRKLEDAGYVTTHRNGSGVTARTSVALTGSGRTALEHYTAVLRQLLDSASQPQARDARQQEIQTGS